MKIAPIDIAHREFSRKIMGLSPDEVTDFLREISDEMEILIRERNNLREQLRDRELSIMEYKERDDLLKNTITTATKMSDKIQVDAEREARLILNDAKQKSEMVVRDARDSLKGIYKDVAELKKVRMQFENNLRAIVKAHLNMLDQGLQIMPNPSVPESNGSVEAKEAQDIRANIEKVIHRAAQSPTAVNSSQNEGPQV